MKGLHLYDPIIMQCNYTNEKSYLVYLLKYKLFSLNSLYASPGHYTSLDLPNNPKNIVVCSDWNSAYNKCDTSR